VDLVDGDALVGQVQHTIVQVGAGVTLGPHDLLDAVNTPPRPGVRREHDLALTAEQVQRAVDLPGPFQGVSDQRAAEGVGVVDGRDDVLRGPERLQVGEQGAHFGRSLCSGMSEVVVVADGDAAALRVASVSVADYSGATVPVVVVSDARTVVADHVELQQARMQ
jgi:hypothetical protein